LREDDCGVSEALSSAGTAETALGEKMAIRAATLIFEAMNVEDGVLLAGVNK